MRRSLLLLVAVVAVLTMGLTVVGTASALPVEVTFAVKKTTDFNSVNRKAAKVHCPVLSVRTGGGATVDGSGSRRHVAIHKSGPIPDDGWRAAAHETRKYGRNWSLTVRVVCVGIQT